MTNLNRGHIATGLVKTNAIDEVFKKRPDEGYRLFTRGQCSFAPVHLSTTVKVVQSVRFLNATSLPQLAKQKESKTKGQKTMCRQ